MLSATGAGARSDPTRIRVADLRESSNDPLSRAVIFSSQFYYFCNLHEKYIMAPGVMVHKFYLYYII